jgi:hypothetical protein
MKRRILLLVVVMLAALAVTPAQALPGRLRRARLDRGRPRPAPRLRPAIEAWEKFRIPLGEYNGEWTTIQSVANGRYVSAEQGWSGDRQGLLRARAADVGAWEMFGFIPCSFVWEACPE